MQSRVPKLKGLKASRLSPLNLASYKGWEGESQRWGLKVSGSAKCLGFRNVAHGDTEMRVCERD